MTRDPYDVLGLPDDASEEAIRTAYRQLARTFHPDVNPDPSAVERFREITEAYVVLSDPDLRARHNLPSWRASLRRPRGEETQRRIGLNLAGIDLGGLLGVTVHVETRPLSEGDVEPRSGPPVRARRRLRPRRR